MKRHSHKHKTGLFSKIYNPQSLMFHIAGIAAIIWFLLRVLPKPDRIRYPCQQMSIGIAFGYIAFWSLMFHGLAIWIRRAKSRTAAIAPVFLVGFVLIASISGIVIADTYYTENSAPITWDPLAKDPIGTPAGLNPGRVVWVWNPNATEKNFIGYWWLEEYNDQDVLNEMFSQGIQGLAGESTDSTSWDALFTFFNKDHGYEEVGYQPGEKIAIKVNLNNCYGSYTVEDNNRDASPYVVKALLGQLVDVVGVDQNDIYIYDASRKISNWFYERVYNDFPDIHYVDSDGGAEGREKVISSSEKIYFADGLIRTLPTVVTEAKYLINMPLLKRHPIDWGVTLSGKNFFGTWIEEVSDVHAYHKSAFTSGNPTPQTDLLAHEHIGGKVLLYIGDGTFPTKIDHSTIGKYTMKPFNRDWTNSLFFSQDPVAIDSVMYDFIFTEGCNPCEGSQNYLHQCAEPLQDTYDPEGDGVYLSESLGVHEHWDTEADIFSSDRYDGIDFVTIGEEHVKTKDPKVKEKPLLLREILMNKILIRFHVFLKIFTNPTVKTQFLLR
jgi:hypothetical protein